MKPVNFNKNPNALDILASQVKWDQPSIEFLGICEGEYLPNIIWEIVEKLKELTGEEDIKDFDIDTLLNICNTQRPSETTLLSILNLLKDNQICLKDYINSLQEEITNLNSSGNIDINLKCLASYDAFGNIESVTRKILDQKVINKLCEHSTEIESIKLKLINLEDKLNEEPSNTADPYISTCIDANLKKSSEQIKITSTKVCNLISKLGEPDEISLAISRVPSYWITPGFQQKILAKFGPNVWILNPTNWADIYHNHLLAYTMLEEDVVYMKNNCCNTGCDAIKIGFSVIPDEDGLGYIFQFRNTDGNNIPEGFEDAGSKITITDSIGLTYGPWNIDVVKEQSDIYYLQSSSLNGPITVNIDVKLFNKETNMFCEKCINKTLTIGNASCPVCKVTATNGSVTIIYEI